MNDITDEQALNVVRATFDPKWEKKKLKLKSFLPSCPSIKGVGIVSAKTTCGYEMEFNVVQTHVVSLRLVITPSGKRWDAKHSDKWISFQDSLKATVTRGLTYDPDVEKNEDIEEQFPVTLDTVLIIRVNGAAVGNMFDHGPTKKGLTFPRISRYYEESDIKQAKLDFENFKAYFYTKHKERMAEVQKKKDKKNKKRSMFS